MDIQYLLLLQDFREATGNIFSSFLSKITVLGNLEWGLLILFVVYWALDKEFGTRALVAGELSRIANGVLKLWVCAYRPWIKSDLVQPYGDSKAGATGYSFPSGHTTNATMNFGQLAWYYRKKKILCGCFIALLALIMFSRNYLGVHTPQDVVCGFFATVLCIVAGYRLTDWMNAGKNRDVVILVVELVIGAALMYWFTHKGYPMDYNADGSLVVDPIAMIPDSFTNAGYMLGTQSGLCLERRYVGFTTDVSAEDRLARILSGLLIGLFLLNVGGAALPGIVGSKHWAKAVLYFSVGVYCTFIHPALFTWWEKKNR